MKNIWLFWLVILNKLALLNNNNPSILWKGWNKQSKIIQNDQGLIKLAKVISTKKWLVYCTILLYDKVINK
jgi:hypothetical protein